MLRGHEWGALGNHTPGMATCMRHKLAMEEALQKVVDEVRGKVGEICKRLPVYER